MRGQPNRLAAETAGPFSGSAIDRRQPLQFRLDGRTIAGFVGDTVLSAVLASGIDAVGKRGDSTLALSPRFAPAIIPAALATDTQRALAMERTPAKDGADYVTLAPRKRQVLIDGLRRLASPSTTLGLDLDHPAAMRQPWLTIAGVAETPAQLIVVGGGIAGMAAAVAAANAGLSVLVVEASPRLGGHARLFGTLEGEEAADASFVRLGAAIASAPNVTTLTHAAAFALRPGVVRVHITDVSGPTPTARVVDMHAPHIVLATGATERLPVFSGNRLPGAVGVRDAYDLAEHYGVWCGQSAIFATASSAAYRLAMLARDAGIAVPRIIDARPQPQSRFIEYSKAYGMTLAAGTIIAEARRASQGRGLSITPQLAVDGFNRTEPGLKVDRLVVCGGWQPELSLWHMAGGNSQWNAQRQRLEAANGPDGIVLAGNAAGHLGHQACLESGQAAIDALLGRAPRSVSEHGVDPIYETPDAATPIAPIAGAGDSSFLDGGRSWIERPTPAAARRHDWIKGASAPDWSLADGPHALGAPDVAAGVQLREIDPAHAGRVAQQRVPMVTIATAADRAPTAHVSAPLVPEFLTDRYGSDAGLWLIKPHDARWLEAGALIQPNSDVSDPAAAVGVVLRHNKDGCIALLRAGFAQAGQTAAVCEPGRATPVRVLSAYPAEQV